MYKSQAIELHFDLNNSSKSSKSHSQNQSPLPDSETVANPNQVPDLKADDLMDYDKILNWSGTPDYNEIPLPLTGEEAPQKAVAG